MRRLLSLFGLIGLAAATLWWLAPTPAALLAELRAPAPTGATDPGPALLAAVTLAAWLLLAWLAVGLVAVLAGTLPGLAGATGRFAAAVLLPGALRHALALAVGVGVLSGVQPGVAVAGPPPPAATTTQAAGDLDWPERATPAPPSPTPPPVAGEPDRWVTVEVGDSLWALAAGDLPRGASDAEISVAVSELYDVNRSTVGPDPDLILPGQRLLLPGSPR